MNKIKITRYAKNWTLLLLKHKLRVYLFHSTYPDSVYLSQQFGVILLHSLQALEHGSHMGLT